MIPAARKRPYAHFSIILPWLIGTGFAVGLVGSPLGSAVRADELTAWHAKASGLVVDAKLGPPLAWRVLAIAHTAVYEAVQGAERSGASADAAIAAAHHAVLARLLPSPPSAIDSAYQAALARIPDGPAKTTGLAAGEAAAASVLAARADDGAAAAESYRPYTTAGIYVPTVLPAFPQWPQRKPWFMTSADQFRPGPPPALTSEVWTRDFGEIKALGARNNSRRTAEQTAIARFWEATEPSIYEGVVRSVAAMPGRAVKDNARLFALVAQATDDALIAVFDAKYHYNFWRPITAIRNADLDGNDATERDPSWVPLIETPMHPEYPCAHCIVSATIGTVLQAEIDARGAGKTPTLTSTSPTAPGAARSWASIEDFLHEVANARIYDGVHYRNSTEVGTAMGRQVGALALAQAPPSRP